jgi:flagellar hook assembly protein FlgD
LFESQGVWGSRSLTWDGRGDAGTVLPRGVYFLKLTAGGKTTTAKLVLLR